MKFTNEHYYILKARIESIGVDKLKSARKEYIEKALSDQRFIFDVFWASKTKIGDGIGMSSNCGIEGDYNDSHIGTATKKALQEIGIL